MTFQIEDNIAVPSAANRSKYPFAAMQPGQSFHVACAEKAGKRAATIRSCATKHGEAKGTTWRTSVVGAEDPKGAGVRVWRLT